MNILIVSIKIKPGMIEAFRAASLENARESLKEKGIGRFDLLQDSTDPARFVLIEGYLDSGAPALHKQTAHYNKWRETTEPMMAEPRTRNLFELVEPRPSV